MILKEYSLDNFSLNNKSSIRKKVNKEKLNCFKNYFHDHRYLWSQLHFLVDGDDRQKDENVKSRGQRLSGTMMK